MRGERQHVTIAVQPNLDALGTHGPPVSHPHDTATATGDLTGAFSRAHPRLHTTPHRGRQLRDLGIGKPIADHQPGQRFERHEATKRKLRQLLDDLGNADPQPASDAGGLRTDQDARE